MNIIENKHVLITGGGGFIGSNLVEELSKNNKVSIIDNLSTGKRNNIQNFDVNFIKGSITDLNTLKMICKDVDYIFHLAALASVPRSVKEPKIVNEVNITGTVNVLIAAKDLNIKKVVFASSSAVYGDTPTLPKIETMQPNPLSPYAVSKLSGEYYCKVFYEVYGLPTSSLRFFNVYGPKQDPKSEYAAVIPKFIQQIQNNNPPLIYGDGKQSRDFTFVKDVVRAVINAAYSNEANGQVINVAAGKRITIEDLAIKISKLMGKDLSPEFTDERPGDIKHSWADINKAKSIIDYEPRYSIDDGLTETINFFKKFNTENRP
jgi:UDP-glucose 4-epimerase